MPREKSKKIFVGIDIGKEKNFVSIVYLREYKPKYQFEIKNTYHGFNELKSYIDESLKEEKLTFNECILGIESTGNYGSNLFRYFNKLDIDVVSVSGIKVKKMKDVYDDIQDKNDKVDAKVISYCLRDNIYTEIKSKKIDIKGLRQLTRMLDAYKVSLGQVTNRIHTWVEEGNQVFKVIELDVKIKTGLNILREIPCVYEAKGLTVSEVAGKLKRNMTIPDRRILDLYLQEAEIARKCSEPLSDLQREEIKELLAQYDFLTLTIENLEQRIKDIALTIEPSIERYLNNKIPGMSERAFISILAETNFMKDFKTARSLLNFCGLNLVGKSSGKEKGKMQISKTGSSHIRKQAYILLDSMTRLNTDVRKLYCYYKTYEREKSVSKKAMFFATVNKIIRCFYGAIKTETDFEVKKLLEGIDFSKCNKKKFKEEMKPISQRSYN